MSAPCCAPNWRRLLEASPARHHPRTNPKPEITRKLKRTSYRAAGDISHDSISPLMPVPPCPIRNPHRPFDGPDRPLGQGEIDALLASLFTGDPTPSREGLKGRETEKPKSDPEPVNR